MTFSVISHFPHLLLPKDTDISYLAVASSEKDAQIISDKNPGSVVTQVGHYTYVVTIGEPSGNAVIDQADVGVTTEVRPSRAQPRRGSRSVDKRLANARVIA